MLRRALLLSTIASLPLWLAGCNGEDADEDDDEASSGWSTTPDLAAIGLDGQTLSLAPHKGDVVVLNFWAGGCGPCLVEMPILQDLHERHRQDGLAIVGINVGELDFMAADTVRRTGVTYPIGIDQMSITMRRYRVPGAPTTVIIDRRGRIRDTIVGSVPADELKRRVRAWL